MKARKVDLVSALRDGYGVAVADIDYWEDEGAEWVKADLPVCTWPTDNPNQFRAGKFLVTVSIPKGD